MNVGSLLARHARYRPDHLAVVVGSHRLTFGEVRDRVNRLAHALTGLGLRKGDRVALVLPNCIELLDAYRACAQQGLVSVPLSTLLRGPGLVTLLRDSGATAVIGCQAVAAALEEARSALPGVQHWMLVGRDAAGFQSYDALVADQPTTAPDAPEIGDDDVYNIIYSSGTTGDPKGIIHTHQIRALYGSLFASRSASRRKAS